MIFTIPAHVDPDDEVTADIDARNVVHLRVGDVVLYFSSEDVDVLGLLADVAMGAERDLRAAIAQSQVQVETGDVAA